MITGLSQGWEQLSQITRAQALRRIPSPFAFSFAVGRPGRTSIVLLAGIAAIAAVCVSLLISTLSKLYDDAIDRSKRESAEFAAVLAGQTSRSVEAINLVLEELANRIAIRIGEEDPALAHASDEETHRYLRLRLSRLPSADVISVVNSDGRIVNLTRSWPTPNFDVSNRDYFQAVKTGSKDFVISEPVANQVNGETLVFFARRIEASTGVFLGAVVVGARPEKLVDANAADAHVQGRTLVLARRDGVLLAHSQSPKSAGTRFPPSAPWYTLVAKGGGDYRSPGY